MDFFAQMCRSLALHALVATPTGDYIVGAPDPDPETERWRVIVTSTQFRFRPYIPVRAEEPNCG